MLKVEKKGGVIAVSGHSEKKHSFILTAFLYAFCIHAFGLIIFHIAPINILGSGSSQAPPAMVTSEWKEEIISSTEEPAKPSLLQPPPKRPIFEKKLPDLLATRMLVLPWESWFEKESNSYMDQTYIKELSTVATGIEIQVTGDLSHRSLEWKNPPTTIPPEIKSYPAVAKFAVEVNEATGEVFRKTFLEGDASLALAAAGWIDQMQFSSKPNRFSVKGEIMWTVGEP
jgi:hypothetical protein